MVSMVSSAVAFGNDHFKELSKVCKENGFSSETHTVTTDDGYILNLSRIPGKTDDSTTGKPVALFMHCQDCSMMEWVANEPSQAPAFVLADLGYDVWLGNNRGNTFSRNHTEYDHHTHKFWDFYQEDKGRVDVPTFIDYILEETDKDQLTYIGHSEGTTQFLIGASMDPEYFTEKVNLFMALAPVGSTANIPINYIRFAAQHIGLIDRVVQKFHWYNLFPAPPEKYMKLAERACTFNLSPVKNTCKNIFKLMGHDGVDDPWAGANFMSWEPAGDSWRTFVYYAQSIKNNSFSLYDYGKSVNNRVYGSDAPPAVPLENYNVTTALFSGDLDKLANPTDVAWLSSQISDHVVFEQQYHLDHFSFALAKNMTYFTTDAVRVIQTYNPLDATQ